MSLDVDNKTDKMKFIREIVLLITAIITLVVLCLQIFKGEKNINGEAEVGHENKVEIDINEFEDKLISDQQNSEEIVAQEKENITSFEEAPVESNLSKKIDLEFNEKNTLDTFSVVYPSVVKIEEILMDGKPIEIIKLLPTRVTFITNNYSNSSILRINAESHFIELSLNLLNKPLHSLTIDKFKKK